MNTGLFSSIFLVGIWEPGLREREALDPVRQIIRMRTHSHALPRLGGVRKLAVLLEWFIRCLLRFAREDLSAISAHNLTALPLGVLLRALRKCHLIYDTHELETEASSARGLRKWGAKLVERALFNRVDATIVVSPSIASWYRTTYRSNTVVLVRNIPPRAYAPTTSGYLHKRFSIPRSALVFIYQGVLARSRGTELILRVFTGLGHDHHVVFMGFGPATRVVEAFASRHSNIHYHPPVSPTEMPKVTGGADVGLSVIERTCLSYYYCLPNKLFEYLCCAIPVIVSDFPDMAAVVDETGAGWKVAVTDAALGAVVRGITREDLAAKRDAARAVQSQIGWHTEEEVLYSVYERLFRLPARRLSERRLSASGSVSAP